MISWKDDRLKCLNVIATNRSKFKVFLKTKNEEAMLSDWIDWHSAICGASALFIFDNLSDNKKTLDIYRDYPELNVISFDGFHNDLHRPSRVTGLYESIYSCTDHFIFLDTDERLTWLRNDLSGFVRGSEIYPVIAEKVKIAHPTIWIENVVGKYDEFIFDKNLDHFKSGLRLGKPIISSHAPISEMMNHNFQLNPESFLHIKNFPFVVLHLKNLDIGQRIRSNIHKLIAYNAFKCMNISSRPSVEEILNLNAFDFPAGNKRNWIMEIQKLASVVEANSIAGSVALSKWRFTVVKDGDLCFGSRDLEVYFKTSLS